MSQSRQLEVSVDSEGFIVVNKHMIHSNEQAFRKINLRKDAKFEDISSVKDLYDMYMLELKLRRRHDNVSSGIERLIMLRYVVFTQFTQAIYPMIYIIILRRLIGTALAHKAICVDNKMSAESREPISIDSKLDIMNENQIMELENIYTTLLSTY